MLKATKKYILTVFLLGVACATVYAQNKLSQEDQRKFDYYFYQSLSDKGLGKFDSAYDLLIHCYEMDSTNANVNFELGNYYNMLDKKDQALSYFGKASQLDPDNYYYSVSYASLCLSQLKYAEAIDLYEKLIKTTPDNPELYIYLSEAYRLNEDLPMAVKTLDRLETVIGLNEKISLQKYQLYKTQDQEKKAYAEILKYIEKYPNEMKYRILLGNLYMESDKFKEAYKIFTQAKEIDPEDPYLISSMADYYEKTNNKEAAENELRTALVNPKMDVDTKLAVLTQYIGTLYQTKKDTEAANALLDTLLIQHPQESKLNLMYGNLLMLQEKKDEARFQFQLFADANPSNPTGWEQMLSTAFPDSVDLAISICKNAITYNEDEPQFYFYLGLSQFLKENYDDALISLKDGLKYVPEQNVGLMSNFYGQIGDIYYQTKQTDSAFVYYDMSLKYNPNNVLVLNNYSYYLSLEKKDLHKAESMSSKTVKLEPTNPTYLDTYGWVLFQQKAYTLAKIYIGNAVKYSEESGEKVSSEVYEHYGDVLYLTDEKEEALKYWKKAKERSVEEEAETEPGIRKSSTLDRKIETKTYIEQ
ncbi:tetratricopeptide repeat protein [Dysgonomonas massiliensis]|uniref:tetratricopeptide repeat protein n=1 Tax=Dysgonomonas massiliensis TaxID=2040292 RepID=UPI000C786426|nr:tetratricopeptide repeat protein [Dysgonomonas massiliensis]